MNISRSMQVTLLCALVVCIGGCQSRTEKGNDIQPRAEKRDDSIHPALSLPETTPWDMAALSKPPQFRWISQNGKFRSLYYMGMPYKGRETVVFAYYATPGSISGDPSRDKDLPAIVLVHGGGGRAYPEWVYLWAQRGYAAIAMNLAGRGGEPEIPDGMKVIPDVYMKATRKPLKDGGPDQTEEVKFGQPDRPDSDQWTYHAVSNVILAHSLIRSFKEVDPGRTAIEGNSWGGYVTLIAAALDNRFKAAVNVFGSGFLHENSFWLSWFDKMTTAQKKKWVQLWDPSMYIGSATVPMLFVSGATEEFFPIDSFARTVHLWKGSWNLRLTPEMVHSQYYIFDPKLYSYLYPVEIELFVGQYLKGGTPLPKVTNVKVSDDKVLAEVMTRTKLTSASLCYTTDTGMMDKRKWKTNSGAKIDGNHVTAEPPPHDATIWFISVTDERGAVVSSEPFFTKADHH